MIEQFLSQIKDKVGPDNFDFWFKTSDFIFDNNDFKIYSPNIYLKNNLKERYLKIMEETYCELTDSAEPAAFTFYIKEPVEEEVVLRPPDEDETPQGIPQFPGRNNPNLNEKYTFDNFVVGDNNQCAQAAATAVATSPGKQFNPLFIYGGVGLGKTHLMQAIGHYVYNTFDKLKVLYMTSEEFTNNYINALTQKKTKQFREKYRHIDLLLIDDIQFLVGKEMMQEEFFHTFNTLYSSEKQLVISSDRPPKELSSLEDRLRSRFECGLQADIQPPKYETRVAILKRLCEENSLIIQDDIINFIATHVKSNVRELEGAFNKVTAFTRVMKVGMTLELAYKILKDIIPELESNKNISIDLIIKMVSKHFDIDVSLMLSDKKPHNVAFARQIAMYLSRELTDLSFTQIGKVFEKDHSTIIYAVEKIKKKLEEDTSLLNLINDLKKSINNFS